MVKDLVNILTPRFRSKDVKITSFVFKLITKYTVNMFLIFTILIGARNIFGNPIECFAPDNQYLKALELKCWLDGVFLDDRLMKSEIGTEAVRYGVGKYTGVEQEKYLTFKFYQWIIPLLLFQTLCLYIPRGLWHFQEKGIMMKLLNKVYSPVITDDWEKQRKQLISYIKDVRKKFHRHYALKYLFCEFLTIVVILLNMFIMKCVISDFWSEYTPAVAAFFQGDMTRFNREAARLFPIQAKCNFDSFGHSGSIQLNDAICILPQNVVNEKIFVVLYIWYIFILICAILNLLYSIVMFASKGIRILNIGHMLERSVTIRECKDISKNGDFGLWFTLSIYRKNMVPIYFQDFCRALQSELKHEKTFEKIPNLDYDEDIEKY